ncbi:FtsW/RodA/SpoVE family cell cycle protein [Exiguobacterium flavidum]|uniref:FtsW/RodA/SpoVE family cell cycle protein n=1 Tax=Exiguobacterium flavidum TaxID=2184695 RepID=UPI000DF78AF8|nr:FtsW/RodA/SpoVE family cell cycle protein [Exiguobacterium flavidum]
MQSNLKEKRAFFDYTLFFTMLILMGVSTVMVYSASVWNGGEYANTSFFIKQIRFDLMAIATFMFCAFFNHQVYKHPVVRLTLYTIGFLLLAATLFAEPLNGARAWINLGFMLVQPAELCKFVFVVCLASYFDQLQQFNHNKNYQINGLIGFVHEALHSRVKPDNTSKFLLLKVSDWIMIPGLVLFVPFGAVIKTQPDVGALFIFMSILVLMWFVAGLPRGYVALGLVLLPAAGIWFYSTFTENQLQRIRVIFNPFIDEEGKGYQLINSVISIAHGGLTGVGLGNSYQKYGYLPEPETDYIMAIIAEELGYIGVMTVLALLFFMIFQGMKIATQSVSLFSTLLAFGITTIIVIQTGINVGAMSGLFPGTGVTLPFISYGGSSLIMMSAMLGVLANISMQNKHRLAYHKEVRRAQSQAQ